MVIRFAHDFVPPRGRFGREATVVSQTPKAGVTPDATQPLRAYPAA